ncbi:hypothetical protein [uncultured Salipiger sp.]|uniref:hypothetical protein n=1 Tax=uncultured Salipiger sp. TaxID=499810 RepID=UPI0025962661|nr:hypothetical protein [uncultured Salipiger sp.]MBR9840268.1 hypothetical protein [Paracoccaceae bacterium]
MIHPGPYEDHAALEIFKRLDVSDYREACLARGAQASHLELFADWRQAQAAGALSLILRNDAGTPFAVLAVVPTARGVAQGAFLARSHAAYRWPIARAALQISRKIAEWARGAGLHRIEARCWADHPSAPRFLGAAGFHLEAQVPGYGPDGNACFLQFAWVRKGGTEHVQRTES